MKADTHGIRAPERATTGLKKQANSAKSDTPTKAAACVFETAEHEPEPLNSCVHFHGTASALLRDHRVDVSAIQQQHNGYYCTAVFPDGHRWHLRWHEPFVRAWRYRTAAEAEQWQDQANSRRSFSWFSVDRVAMTRDISLELMTTSEAMRDHSSRSQRRALKKKLEVLGCALYSLSHPTPADMPWVREQLRSIGMDARQYFPPEPKP